MRVSRGLLRQSVAALVIGWFVLLPATPAFAHGGGDSNQSRVLVLDALAYLANKPPHYEDEAMDKVKDALTAMDTAGVSMDKLTMAKHEMDAGQMMQARTLLQESLVSFYGQQPISGQMFNSQMSGAHMSDGHMLYGHVMGEDPGTLVMLDPLKGSTNWSGSSGLVAGASVLAVLAGLVLARRWRPPESLPEIRSHLTGEEGR